MTPGARIAAAIEVLGEIETRHRPVAAALKDWGLSHRFAGSKDRAAIGNIVYDALRPRRSLAAAMGEDTPRALALGVVGRLWGEGSASVSAMLETQHAPEPLSAEETARLDAPELADLPDAVRADVPDWVAPSLARGLGADWVAEMQAMAERPPLDLRVNRLKADRGKVLRALSRHGPAETGFSPDGIRIAATAGEGRHPNVQSEPAFQKGWFEIQDEGSQLAALMVGAAPGEQVFDLCAGGGGKTLALAAAMANKGQIHATDNDRHRLAPIFERLKRAGTRNVQVHPADVAFPLPNPPPQAGEGVARSAAGGGGLTALHGKMDRVLIDAPCTGSGTWRRHPDAKWRLTERALAERVAEQAALLRDATMFVRPGGLLVYVTCSLFPEENEDQVTGFIADRPDFSSLEPAEMIANAGLAAETTERLLAATARPGPGLLLTPRRTGTDGFFIAAFRRASAE